jgi:hypothetical protein
MLADDLTSETFLRALRRIDSVSYQGRDPAISVHPGRHECVLPSPLVRPVRSASRRSAAAPA